MLRVLATPRSRILTAVFLAAGCVSLLAAAAVGVSDNPPGIFLAFLAAVVFVLAFVHPWRTAKEFGILLLASALGFLVFGILHNVFEAIAGPSTASGLFPNLLRGFAVATFLLAVLVCPPAAVVGAVGSVVMLVRKRGRPD